VPVVTLVAPNSLNDAAKLALMQAMYADIHKAYPMYGTYIFITENQRTDSTVDGELMLDNGQAHGRGDGRICTLRCPPGASADSKKTMMAEVTKRIDEAYPNAGTTFIVLLEDDLHGVMINGLLQSEDPRFQQPA